MNDRQNELLIKLINLTSEFREESDKVKSRELSLVITKLEEATHWFNTLKAPEGAVA